MSFETKLIIFALFVGAWASPLTILAEVSYQTCRLDVDLGPAGTGVPYSLEAVEGIEIESNKINAHVDVHGKHSN